MPPKDDYKLRGGTLRIYAEFWGRVLVDVFSGRRKRKRAEMKLWENSFNRTTRMAEQSELDRQYFDNEHDKVG